MPNSFVDQHYAPLTRSLTGRILELGCGRQIKADIDVARAHLIATDPSPANLRSARQRARHRTSSGIDFVITAGEALPFADQSFDAIIGSFAFCSVDDVDHVAAELARVARPSASLVLIEHVRSDRPVVGWLQDAITPAYARLFRNCHLNRHPLDALRQHGFQAREAVRRGSILPWTVVTGSRIA